MQRISGLVVFLIGLAILWQGSHLGMGTARTPGSGFFPNLVAIGLMVLSLVLVIKGGKDEEEEKRSFSLRATLRILIVFLALMAYSFLLEYLGFLLTSFMLTTYLFWAFGSKKWYMAVAWAATFVVVAYLLFDVVLEANLPKGVLGI
jgi:putative tricarboxylic transport membrane protein